MFNIYLYMLPTINICLTYFKCTVCGLNVPACSPSCGWDWRTGAFATRTASLRFLAGGGTARDADGDTEGLDALDLLDELATRVGGGVDADDAVRRSGLGKLATGANSGSSICGV